MVTSPLTFIKQKTCEIRRLFLEPRHPYQPVRSRDPRGGVASSKRFNRSGQRAHLVTFYLTAEQPNTSLCWSAASLKQRKASKPRDPLLLPTGDSVYFCLCAGCSITGCSGGVFFSIAAAVPSAITYNHSPASLLSSGPQHSSFFPVMTAVQIRDAGWFCSDPLRCFCDALMECDVTTATLPNSG